MRTVKNKKKKRKKYYYIKKGGKAIISTFYCNNPRPMVKGCNITNVPIVLDPAA